MRLQISIIPQEIINKYNQTSLVDVHGWVCMKISTGMYGLKQAGIIAHRKFIKHLAPYGYHPISFTRGLWKNVTKPTMFTLVVDNFSIKYLNIYEAEIIFPEIRDKYTISTDMECKNHIVIKLAWDYINKRVTLSMPN